MGDRKDKINREIAKEQDRIKCLKRRIEEYQREIDRCIEEGSEVGERFYREKIEELEKKIELEKARIAGKIEIRDKPKKVDTKDLIKEEQEALKKKRKRRDELRAKDKRTSKEEKELERLKKEIVIEGAKIEGKEKAGAAVDEFKIGSSGHRGSYKFGLSDPLGRELFALLLPNYPMEAPVTLDRPVNRIDDIEIMQRLQERQGQIGYDSKIELE